MGFGDYLSQTFPGVRITSGKRDPDSALGRANPKSFHNVGMAWDVAPIPGMTFDDYRNRVAQDGWNVREAIDEVNHPSVHATGPHWHMAVDGRKEQQPMALADLMKNNPAMQPPKVAGLSVPGAEPMSLASYLTAPLMNEAMQPAQMPNPGAGFVDMAPVAGVKPKGRGTANDIMGSIFDALAAAGGAQPTYWAGVVDQQQRDEQGRQRLAERQAERKATLDDWIYQQQYKAANLGPAELPADAKLLQWYNGLPDDQKRAYAAFKDVQNPIAVSGPQGTYRVPRGYGQPTNTPVTQIVDGQTYYQINGKWYDNPEGR